MEPAGPPLRIGAYVTNISDIDLLQDQFSVEMLLWTTWAGDPQADPSDQLMILNGIYDGDIQRFERVSHEQTAVCRMEPLPGAFGRGQTLAAAALSL